MSILSSDNPQGARIRAEARGPEDGGEFVLYWMATALRSEENPALEVAVTLAEQRGLPLLVYQPLFAQAWHATDRSHAFILEGVPDLARSLADRGIRHVMHIVNSRAEDPPEVVARLASRAAVVVTEDFPCGPYPFWRRAVAEGAARTLYVVDTSCILPMQLVGKAYDRAFAFRNSTSTRRNRWVDQEVACAGRVPAWDGDPGFEPVVVRREDIPSILSGMEIDHGVGRVHWMKGGERDALARWADFRERRLHEYHERRNDAADMDGVSWLSPYIHHGMIAPWRLARETRAIGGEGPEKFLDELMTWREMSFCFCRFRPDHDTLNALPKWARDSLLEQSVNRISRPSLDQIERGQTGDVLFDLCQTSLVRHGVLHNNVRMTWGKALAAWFEDPGEGLQVALDLNHRYALDGCDPNSYGGILYCFGQFDGARRPPDSRLGLVRPRPTEAHLGRLGEERFRTLVRRPRGGVESCLVIGAGMTGLLAAQVLHDHGVCVTVLDKGRGVGGRMATRRFEGGVFDHGAQFFTVRDPRFGRHVARWADAEVVARWSLGFAGNGRPLGLDGHTRFRGTHGMTSLPKHLARGIHLYVDLKIVRVGQRDGRWVAAAEDGREWTGDTMILTPPVPQSLALLAAGGTTLPADIREALASLEYDPCVALLVTLDGPSAIPDPGAIQFAEGPVSWIADNRIKGISPEGSAVTIHASPGFSAAHYEENEESVAAALLEAAAPSLGSRPVAWQVRRWRFSQPKRTWPSPLVVFGGNHPLVFAGDAFGGARVEGAALSGLAAAGHILSLPG